MNVVEERIGMVLTQQGKPVVFMSRALGVTKKSWSIYAKEMLAIVEVIHVWWPYLLGRKFFIQTDQFRLKYFLEQHLATPKQQKWVAKFLGYNYEITYHPGRENLAVDTLSRKPNSQVLNHLHLPTISVWDEIRKAYEENPYIQLVAQLAKTQTQGPYTQQQGYSTSKTGYSFLPKKSYRKGNYMRLTTQKSRGI